MGDTDRASQVGDSDKQEPRLFTFIFFIVFLCALLFFLPTQPSSFPPLFLHSHNLPHPTSIIFSIHQPACVALAPAIFFVLSLPFFSSFLLASIRLFILSNPFLLSPLLWLHTFLQNHIHTHIHTYTHIHTDRERDTHLIPSIQSYLTLLLLLLLLLLLVFLLLFPRDLIHTWTSIQLDHSALTLTLHITQLILVDLHSSFSGERQLTWPIASQDHHFVFCLRGKLFFQPVGTRQKTHSRQHG